LAIDYRCRVGVGPLEPAGATVVSLTDFIKRADVVDRIKPFRPEVRWSNFELKVPRVYENPSLTGTAFDYLLRFELQRRAPHAKHGEWIAEKVPALILPPRKADGTQVYEDRLWGKDPDLYIPPHELSRRISGVCASARAAVDAHAKVSDPSTDSTRELAAWAVRLAKIDGIYRRNEVDMTFDAAPLDLVKELVDLLAVAPFERLVHPDRMLLNPTFGAASAIVGSADADLISGDMLIDFKTTKSAEVRGEHMDQLFGYFLLNRRAGFPEIKRVGLYFSRYGRTRFGETAVWTERPDFEETERWFFKRAEEVFGSKSAASGIDRG
jgi:hypothetical protein